MIKLSSSRKSVDYVRCLIYGESGMGKTPLSATAPKPIFIDSDDGLLSISALNLPSLKVNDYEDLNDAIDFLKKKKNQKRFETIVVDDLTEIAEVVLANLEGTEKDGRRAYMKLFRETKKVIRRFKKLPYNIIFICKLTILNDDGLLIRQPAMSGKALPEWIPYSVDEVFALTKQKKIRYLLTEKNKKWYAKDRSCCLNKKEKPNMTEIFNKIKKGKNNGEKKR